MFDAQLGQHADGSVRVNPDLSPDVLVTDDPPGPIHQA
jgi:hypothetical protein